MTGQRRDSKVKILSGESSVAYSPHTTVHLLGGESRKMCVDVSGLSASWSMERGKQVLTDISFQVDQVTSGSNTAYEVHVCTYVNNLVMCVFPTGELSIGHRWTSGCWKGMQIITVK